jgi:hypothetical protein
MIRQRPLRLWVIGLLGIFLLLSLAPVGASSANISHSYATSDNLSTGNLVSLNPKRTDFVESASTVNGNRLIGVVVGDNESLLAVNETAGKVQVATSGTVSALVTDLNGKIKVGDRISVSPFKGIGSKVLPGAYILGLAQTGFDGSASGTRKVDVTDKQGVHTRLTVGFVRLNLAISPPASTGPAQLNSLQKFAVSVTGHSVSTARIIISLVIAIVTLFAFVTLMYGAIYGGIISIGRNPLAKHAIFRSLASVLILAGSMSIVSASLIWFLLH